MNTRIRQFATFPTITIVALALVAFALAPNLKGSWTGRYVTASAAGDLFLKVDSTAKGLAIQVKSVTDRYPTSEFQPADELKTKGDSISFVMNWGGPVVFEGKVAGDQMTGKVTAQYWNGTWSVKRDGAKAK